MQQAFRPLRISNSNLNLNLNLNPNSLITYIIPNAFVLSPIRLIHDSRPSLHQQRSLYIQSSQVQAYILVRPKSNWFTHQEAFVILVKALTFID